MVNARARMFSYLNRFHNEPMPLLEVKDLNVHIGTAHVLRGVSFAVDAGETLGVVGESGCGKSMTGLALMGMLPPTAQITSGSMMFDGRELAGIREKQWLDVRGQEIAMVMQDPFTSLNPMMRVGDQIAEVYTMHQSISGAEARRKAQEMIAKVGVPNPAEAVNKYPHQMSGGQRQRIVIAIAFAAKPKLLIADEPTTALDVTLQAQILHLLRDLQKQEGTAVVLISHDIAVIGAMARRIAVYYAGRVVELGEAAQVLRTPAHPYTQALLDALPREGVERLRVIPGQPPALNNLPVGCAFAPRCPKRFEKCDTDPALFDADSGRQAACWLIPNPSATIP
jgi:oligopeptide/dipeptide ABC transporter ATP-binding protein